MTNIYNVRVRVRVRVRVLFRGFSGDLFRGFSEDLFRGFSEDLFRGFSEEFSEVNKQFNFPIFHVVNRIKSMSEICQTSVLNQSRK
jgi:hypothetical protein